MKIEIAGPAGSGKSTLTRALVAGNCKFVKIEPPQPNEIRDLPFFLNNFFPALPEFISLPGEGNRKLSKREFAWWMIVNGWSKNISTLPNGGLKSYIFDQGPLFLITSLYDFGPSSMHSSAFSKKWEPLFAKWADVLDMIVFLDAPNECLLNRINSREKEHVIKDAKQEVAYEFLDRWRDAYHDVMHVFSTQPRSPRIMMVDTEKIPLNRICRLIKMEIIHFNEQNEKDNN